MFRWGEAGQWPGVGSRNLSQISVPRGCINTPRGLPSLCVPQLHAPRRIRAIGRSQKRLAAEQSEKDAATIKELQAKLAEASVEAVKASEASAKLSADSAVSALEATKLILARAESLVPDDAKKAASLDGLN